MAQTSCSRTRVRSRRYASGISRRGGGGVSEAENHRTRFGHLGYPWLEETFHNLYYCENIVHDISGYRNAIHELLSNLDRAANDGSGRFFHEKLFFATDQFYGLREENERALKLKQFWTLLFELVGSVYYRWGAPEEAEKFFYGNAHSFRMECRKNLNMNSLTGGEQQ